MEGTKYMNINSHMIYDLDNLPELDDGKKSEIKHNYGQSTLPTMNDGAWSKKKNVAKEKDELFFDYHMAYHFDDLPELDDGKDAKISHTYGEKILPTLADSKQTTVSEMEIEESKESDFHGEEQLATVFKEQAHEAYRARDKKWLPCEVVSKHLAHYIVKWEDQRRGSVDESQLRAVANVTETEI